MGESAVNELRDCHVLCTSGGGSVQVGEETSQLVDGESVFWPKLVLHRLWTEDSTMITQMIAGLRTGLVAVANPGPSLTAPDELARDSAPLPPVAAAPPISTREAFTGSRATRVGRDECVLLIPRP